MSSPGNLNIPPNSIADSKGKGMLWSAFASWIASVTTVANWIVTGTIEAAELNAATLMLSQNVATPAAGQIGAGDAQWILIGSAGAPAFGAGVGNVGGGNPPARYRKMPDNMVEVDGLVTGGTTFWTFPVGYRPLYPQTRVNWGSAGGGAQLLQISPAGIFTGAAGVEQWVTFHFYAEQ